MIYQHVPRGADQVITRAIDTHVEGEKRFSRPWRLHPAGARWVLSSLDSAGPRRRSHRSPQSPSGRFIPRPGSATDSWL